MKINSLTTSRSTLIAWSLFDWAYSAFPTIITTFIFATYFVSQIAVNKTLGTVQWGYTTGIAGLIIAIISPVCGALADRSGKRKRWLAVCTLLCIVTTSLLWFATPHASAIYWILATVILATIAYEVSIVFYNAMLPDLVPTKYLGRISGWAWGLGYAGGLCSLILCLILFINKNHSWLDESAAEHIRICAPFVALWLLVFAFPLFYFVPDKTIEKTTPSYTIYQNLTALWQIFRDLLHSKNIALYLLAKMLYTDGINTIFAFGGIYAAGSFGMSVKEILQFGIAMNIAAGIGAASFAWFDDIIGPKKTIIISLIGIIVTASGILIVEQKFWFWLFALCMSLFFGPAQAASRSLMAHLAPPAKRNEMFGLYALSGKISAYACPWLLSTVTLAYQNQRLGMATILVFLISGLCFLVFVKEA